MSDNACGASTKAGQRVVFAFPDNGYAHDRLKAAEHLTVGEQYRVASVDVEEWSTALVLEEVPGVRFNSVLFSYA